MGESGIPQPEKGSPPEKRNGASVSLLPSLFEGLITFYDDQAFCFSRNCPLLLGAGWEIEELVGIEDEKEEGSSQTLSCGMNVG